MTLSFIFDSVQSIYLWRNSEYILSHQFDTLFPDVKTFTILKNYRTPKQLVDLSNLFRKSFTMHGIEYTPSEPHLPEQKGVLDIKQFETSKEEINYIARNIKELRAQGIPYSQASVLCRSNKNLTDMESGFISYGIPYYLKYDSWSVMRQSPFKFLYSLYSLFVNPHDIFSFCELIRTFKGIGDKFLERIKLQYDNETPVLDFPFGNITKQEKTLTRFVKDFVVPLEQLHTTGCSFSLLNKNIANTMDRLFNFEESAIPIDPNKLDFGVDRGQFLKAFSTLSNVYFIASEDAAFTSKTYHEQFIDIYESLQLSQDVYGKEKTGKEEEKIPEEAVGLHTIHSYKGKENDYVYYAQVNPLSSIDEHDFESRCVFYVAITRSKRKLTMTCSDYALNYENKLVKTYENPFLQEYIEHVKNYRGG
ncbi:MAG: 3'-5' exonuclease [Candidatus Pacearchaeota archaeon]